MEKLIVYGPRWAETGKNYMRYFTVVGLLEGNVLRIGKAIYNPKDNKLIPFTKRIGREIAEKKAVESPDAIITIDFLRADSRTHCLEYIYSYAERLENDINNKFKNCYSK